MTILSFSMVVKSKLAYVYKTFNTVSHLLEAIHELYLCYVSSSYLSSICLSFTHPSIYFSITNLSISQLCVIGQG